jgi:hypothetical protein
VTGCAEFGVARFSMQRVADCVTGCAEFGVEGLLAGDHVVGELLEPGDIVDVGA